jgi:hypothetical protein
MVDILEKKISKSDKMKLIIQLFVEKILIVTEDDKIE